MRLRSHQVGSILVMSLVFSAGFLPPREALAETGVTDSLIKVGGSGSYSGIHAAGANAMREGWQIYFDKINAAGGIHGRKIEAHFLDDAYDGNKGRENAEELINKKGVFAVVGGNGAVSVGAMLGLIGEKKVPLIFPFAFANFMYENKKNIFALQPSISQLAEEVIQYFTKSQRIEKYCVLAQDDSATAALRDSYIAALKKHGLKVVRTSTHSRTDTNLDKNVDELKKADCDAVLFATNNGQAGSFVKSAASKNWHPVYCGVIGVTIPGIKKEIGDAKLKSPIYTIDGTPIYGVGSLPIFEELKEVAQKKADPTHMTRILMTYISAKIFVAALKAAGRELTREGLIKALESMKNLDIGGISISMSSDDHQAMGSGFFYKLENGETTLVGK